MESPFVCLLSNRAGSLPVTTPRNRPEHRRAAYKRHTCQTYRNLSGLPLTHAERPLGTIQHSPQNTRKTRSDPFLAIHPATIRISTQKRIRERFSHSLVKHSERCHYLRISHHSATSHFIHAHPSLLRGAADPARVVISHSSECSKRNVEPICGEPTTHRRYADGSKSERDGIPQLESSGPLAFRFFVRGLRLHDAFFRVVGKKRPSLARKLSARAMQELVMTSFRMVTANSFVQ